jgi:hypothetical protein
MKNGEFEDGETIILVPNRKFIYNKFYDRLEAEDKNVPEIACPKCYEDRFQISRNFDNYNCIAHCICGHSMSVYDG